MPFDEETAYPNLEKSSICTVHFYRENGVFNIVYIQQLWKMKRQQACIMIVEKALLLRQIVVEWDLEMNQSQRNWNIRTIYKLYPQKYFFASQIVNQS